MNNYGAPHVILINANKKHYNESIENQYLNIRNRSKINALKIKKVKEINNKYGYKNLLGNKELKAENN
jgi:hypothetical protein